MIAEKMINKQQLMVAAMMVWQRLPGRKSEFGDAQDFRQSQVFQLWLY